MVAPPGHLLFVQGAPRSMQENQRAIRPSSIKGAAHSHGTLETVPISVPMSLVLNQAKAL